MSTIALATSFTLSIYTDALLLYHRLYFGTHLFNLSGLRRRTLLKPCLHMTTSFDIPAYCIGTAALDTCYCCSEPPVWGSPLVKHRRCLFLRKGHQEHPPFIP
ncbi:hypothetical protein AUEXF2481DRAFT_35802 [Aureobasidium subglaciale EXF-2481]|uniref:Uncharacterized protein n=1 Tax=Aureobasidium subglaciale (strain EXF-2481) TaxID=1043005 RepID=A0A074YUM8_AURSE|nr:uncharacterized protein AUEXF2481DRAFT_35802 [Aureobasidium subglaciale EXF-2481]KEQ99874.1 hypothetical protein AUEXF2481DRAFT_35802 [Aureobasidium subglaciale EXF-2481]